ncbi:type I glutamate--ammonia ligase [Emcibacteraceae bacterium]|uniref:type I glutamate--ammonia ligase n=1 Tax=Pseudemcibacter sp. TaxID=2943293 RepID=UPI00230C79A0|nr:type I glutamate--ammonia ligase [Emcibacteraceae bacterium]MDA9769586.1 type I glutamate--ammonia ligase [Emcibacteraceae bacterium]MDG1021051.1 type I glutamate--ammonia ligase [Emcibacteraceae bacterium]MDG1727756.1 type I glutamate--ammonia ligase [Emcibacteraceae bacterium]
MSDVQKVLDLIKEEEIEYVDLRYSDTKGKMYHISMCADLVDEDMFEEGVMFDGSSVPGWKTINDSDMILQLDPSTAIIDPFYGQATISIFCSVVEPATGEGYGRDPRSTAERAEAYLKFSGIGDTAYFGPEPEFFMFDDVKYNVDYDSAGYSLNDEQTPTNSGATIEGGNKAHRTGATSNYFSLEPFDRCQDIRSEMVSLMKECGLPMDKHHQEVAPSQHELGLTFGTLVETAERVQLYKYITHQVARAYGKTATFMPKPIAADNGSGMHVHMSIWKDGKPLFAGNSYADLSETCLYYIGGIIKHAKAINAFTNPSTNSYKRLVPGFEAPVLLAYSARNRSASCRIPHSASPNGKRVEVRFPDPTANPYLSFAALMMAGLDGIENKIHPGEAMDKDLYHLPPEELKEVPRVAASLGEALDALDADREFLKKGDVFSDDQIDAYIELKREEIQRLEMTPHPVEFEMYYSS